MLWTLVWILLLIAPTARAYCPSSCSCSQKIIDCSSKELTSIPYDLESELINVGILGSQFPSGVKSATKLVLANNKIKGLPTLLLSESLPNLQSIDLANNEIQDVKSVQSVVLNKQLLHFKLSSNPIRHLGHNTDTVLYSQSISDLDVSNCAINSITSPAALSFLMNLTRLDLSGNPLFVVDHLFSSSLTHLNLSFCLLGLNDKGIREETFNNLPKLQYLNLSKNAHLTSMPMAKPLSMSLLNLDASYCAFEKIALRPFPNLQQATFKGNLIKILSNNMLSGNPQLQSLDISENAINFIDTNAFLGGGSLKLLDLSSNHLSNLNWNLFHHTPRLSVFNISRNLFASIDEIPLPSLTSLDASRCEIIKLSTRFLSNTQNLKYLNLSHNSIETFPKRISAPKLLVLDLSFCRISDLEAESFQDFQSIKELNMMGNRLTSPFKENLLNNFVNMTELNLINNPWHCDCNDPEFRKLWRYLSIGHVHTKHLEDLKCQSPKPFVGMSWKQSCFENFILAEEREGKNKAWFSFLVPLLTISCLLAILIVIRHAYSSRGLEHHQPASNQRENNFQRGQFLPRIAPHTFDDDFERGVQLSVNESTRRSPIQELSKLPSYEEALLLPNPQNSEDLKVIVNKYEECGRFKRSSSVGQQTQSDHACINDRENSPSTSGQ